MFFFICSVCVYVCRAAKCFGFIIACCAQPLMAMVVHLCQKCKVAITKQTKKQIDLFPPFLTFGPETSLTQQQRGWQHMASVWVCPVLEPQREACVHHLICSYLVS